MKSNEHRLLYGQLYSALPKQSIRYLQLVLSCYKHSCFLRAKVKSNGAQSSLQTTPEQELSSSVSTGIRARLHIQYWGDSYTVRGESTRGCRSPAKPPSPGHRSQLSTGTTAVCDTAGTQTHCFRLPSPGDSQ